MRNEVIKQSSIKSLRWGWRLLLAACLTTCMVSVGRTEESPNPGTNGSPGAKAIEQTWGIQVSHVFLSGSGNLVDFRYRVVDPVKAAPLTKPENKPVLINLTSGAKLYVPTTPKVGQLRQTTRQPVAGKVYFILFANTQHQVKSGDQVTVMVGDFKAENLTVE
jgi:hypothetical protein